MNVLWVVNTIFPDLCEHLGKPSTVLGGWMYGSAKEISKKESITLSVAATYDGDEIKTYLINNIQYYLIPSKNNHTYNKMLEQEWDKVFSAVHPDLVHIHGTEYAHGLAAMKRFPNAEFVISIQGLVSVCARYFLGGIEIKDVQKSKTLRDYFKGGLLKGQKQFVQKGLLETQYIQKTKHVIGRTFWDYSHTKAINPNVNYHFCNETLRDSFYTSKKWDINLKNEHQIFISQAGTPIKGLHKVLEAVNILKNNYDIKIRIGGHNIIKDNTFIDRLKISGYGKYIRNLISEYGLASNIEFLGLLNEEQMIKEYLNCHVFVCPSSIENSPNSLGEAQILGVPVISSYVGGTPEMVHHGEDGFLYRFEETEMLALLLKEVFDNPDVALRFSENGIMSAQKRHSLRNNVDEMVKIYENIKTS